MSTSICSRAAQTVYGLTANAFGFEFCLHVFDTYLVEFVDGYCYVHHLVGMTYGLGYSVEDFTVVELEGHIDAEVTEDMFHNLGQLEFAQQTAGTYHVDVALVEFAVPAFLGPVGTPYGLYLIAAEREGQFALMLYHVAGQRYGKVVTQTLFADVCRKGVGRYARSLYTVGNSLHVIGGEPTGKVARVENFEQQFVALFAVFACECC